MPPHPRIINIGIHQVAVAQQKSVKPLRIGNSGLKISEPSADPMRLTPASVEIAIAPILIQYGGARSAGLIGKNEYR